MGHSMMMRAFDKNIKEGLSGRRLGVPGIFRGFVARHYLRNCLFFSEAVHNKVRAR